jgi:hypothetical protein
MTTNDRKWDAWTDAGMHAWVLGVVFGRHGARFYYLGLPFGFLELHWGVLVLPWGIFGSTCWMSLGVGGGTWGSLVPKREQRNKYMLRSKCVVICCHVLFSFVIMCLLVVVMF